MKKPKQETRDRIAIKGTQDGLIVTVPEGDWADLIHELASRLTRRAAFFGGAEAVLDAGRRELAVEELRQIGELFSANGMEIRGIRTDAEETVRSAEALNIPVMTGSKAGDNHLELPPSQAPDNALLVKRTIRSGQMLQCSGHVTIIGDVNPGGHVVADGNIMVWGKLRGTVHAGARGDNNAMVCALSLAPTQLRIGSHIARAPEPDKEERAVPEIARVDEKGIIVEPWNATKP